MSSKTAEPDPDWTPTDNPNATVVPGEMRSDREEIPAPFTKEDADKAETLEARSRMARVAAGCQVYWPSPYEVCGVIRDKYNSLGGPGSFLSFPSTGELTNPDGGKRSQFLNGPIYWSAATGAHPVVNSFLNRWGMHQYEAGWLRYPTTDEIVLPDGGRRQEFQQGAIYVAFQNAVGSAIQNGPLRDKYNSVGGLTPGSSFLGYLTEDHRRTLPNSQGQMARFQNGVIYWSPGTGAWPVTGSILNQWAGVGYEASTYGFPIGDPITLGTGPTVVQAFQTSKIYSSGVLMPLGVAGANLVLGFPTGEQLQAAILPGGVKITGNGFEATFVLEYSTVKFDYVRTSAAGPSAFDLLVGLPGGFNIATNPEGGVIIKNAAGNHVVEFSRPFSFDSNNQSVAAQITRTGSRLQLSVGASQAFPLRTYMVADKYETGDAVEYFSGLSLEEQNVCAANAYDCWRVSDSKKFARGASEGAYPNFEVIGDGDNKVDAMRHCAWVANMTEGANEDLARWIMFAHEEAAIRKGETSPLVTAMDTYNNETGIGLGLRHENNEGAIIPECFGYAETARFTPQISDIGTNTTQNDLVVIRQ